MAEAKLLIAGPIVADSSEAGNVYPYVTLEDVIWQLDYQKPFDAVHVTINSPGGRVDKGLGIYDYLRALPGVSITTEAIGQCSSIANAIFLAGDVRKAHRHVEGLVHLPTGGVLNADADGAQEFADDMADTQAKLIALYVERAGMAEDVITELMRKQTTLTADELLSYGIATQIVQPTTALAWLPKPATSPAAADQPPAWAQAFMSKFRDGLATLASAISGARQPAKAQADAGTALKALDVTTTGGATLTIDTGDRDSYAEGDTVQDADGNAAADGDYALSDGNTLTVASGAITGIAPTEKETSATASADQDAAITQLVTAVTALAGEVRQMKTAQATTASTVTRLAAGTGSRAAAPRASAANDGAQDGDDDPAKKAGEARAARRANRYK